MSMFFVGFILLALFSTTLFSHERGNDTSYSKTYCLGRENIKKHRHANEIHWKMEWTKPFTELVPSWNGSRPKKGSFTLYVSIKRGAWSKWLKLASWGAHGQQSFVDTSDPIAQAKCVRIELPPRTQATGFKIKLVAEKGSDIAKVNRLYACTVDERNLKIKQPLLPTIMIQNVQPQSQKRVEHPNVLDICSPTASSMIYWHYALKKKCPLPAKSIKDLALLFVNATHDPALGTPWGNWLFNVAHIADQSKGKLSARVERLEDFSVLHGYLKRKMPVAVSIKGTLTGAFKPYNYGHYVVVTGYDAQKAKVMCLDPAFENEHEMMKAYDYKEFVEAWGKSKNNSYIVSPI